MTETEIKRSARCAQAHGYVSSAMVLLLKVHAGDLLFEDHLEPLRKAISDLITTKHLLANAAGFSKERRG
jgi:hypothetical protein